MKKGFTLIELLGIIVILAIIALITTPIILNVIKSSREKAFVDTGYSIVKSAQNYQTRNSGKTNDLAFTVDYTTNTNTDKIQLKGNNPDSGSFHIDENGKTELKLWNDKADICITKTLDSKKIKIDKDITKENCHLGEITNE